MDVHFMWITLWIYRNVFMLYFKRSGRVNTTMVRFSNIDGMTKGKICATVHLLNPTGARYAYDI